MRAWIWAGLLGALLASSEARAQFQNKSLGVSVGYLNPLSTGGGSIAFGIPFGVTFSYYLDNHFELVVEADGIVARQGDPINSNIWGLSVTPVGVRYLFLEETLRPYVGLDASYLYFFSPQSTSAGVTSVLGSDGSRDFVGVGPTAGIDYFISDTVTVGLKARFNVYISLNSIQESFDASVRVATYF
jgi:outer membrane protein